MGLRTREDGGVVKTDLLGAKFSIYMGVPASPPAMRYHTCVPYRKVTTDEIHPRHPFQGGPFDSRSYHVSFSDGWGKEGLPVDDTNGKITDYSYTGSYRVPPISSYFAVPTSQSKYAETLGARAWAKYNPLKPAVSASIFLAELRDFGPNALVRQFGSLRSLFRQLCRPEQLNTRRRWLNTLADIQQTGRAARSASKLYLAYQFGWKPFLKDVRTFLDSITHTDKKIANLIRNNNRWQRKGGTLFETTTNSNGNTYNGLYPNPGYYTAKSGSSTVVTTERCWFQGSFRYYIPELDDPKWGRFKAHRLLYDLTIGPEQFYKLFPFTWMFDWFSRYGDVVTNLQNQWYNQMTAKYAYIMLHRKVNTELTSKCTTYTQKLNGKRAYYDVVAHATISSETKTRVAASPFGFSVSPADFDLWKISILSALGISKLRF